MVNKIISNIQKSIELKQNIIQDVNTLKNVELIVNKIVECYGRGNKVYFCGNGGSFSDAQHLSAELSGRFYFDRNPLEVVLLGSNFSYLTAVANDYSYDEIFSREIKSSFNEGDILISFSTSGKSKNVIKAIKSIKGKLGHVISFLGNDGGDIKDISNISIVIPSNDTARIQECHMILGHTILELVESNIFKKNK
jgi:D-sedoheptulose 7-phosphate isomerase